MQIRKTYKNVNPQLLYDEVSDFVQKQGGIINEAKLVTYSAPGGTHVVRGTLVFKFQGQSAEAKTQGFRAHIVGSAAGDTKMMLDIDQSLFPQGEIDAVQADLDFIFGEFEVKPR